MLLSNFKSRTPKQSAAVCGLHSLLTEFTNTASTEARLQTAALPLHGHKRQAHMHPPSAPSRCLPSLSNTMMMTPESQDIQMVGILQSSHL
jgi:hypothetical protein